jgi:hypothetical protein
VALFALFPIALAFAACFDLQKVDPGARVIDDFEDGGLVPEWQRLKAWSCDTDGGPNGGQPDADGGQSMSCGVENGGDTDKYALRADFSLKTPLAGDQQPVAEVVTRTISGTVDVTGFKRLAFSACLETSPDLSLPLPSGTLFQVELGCSAIKSYPFASQTVPYLSFKVKYPDQPFQLPLDMFVATKGGSTLQSQTCLGQVDSIHFTIKPELPNGMSTGGIGTLHLDNITLQN